MVSERRTRSIIQPDSSEKIFLTSIAHTDALENRVTKKTIWVKRVEYSGCIVRGLCIVTFPSKSKGCASLHSILCLWCYDINHQGNIQNDSHHEKWIHKDPTKKHVTGFFWGTTVWRADCATPYSIVNAMHQLYITIFPSKSKGSVSSGP